VVDSGLVTATPVEESGQPGGSAGSPSEENTEITPEQLRSMSIEELDKLLVAEGIQVPDNIDVSNQDAIVDWIISEFS
jgi:hypothetical protein